MKYQFFNFSLILSLSSTTLNFVNTWRLKARNGRNHAWCNESALRNKKRTATLPRVQVAENDCRKGIHITPRTNDIQGYS